MDTQEYKDKIKAMLADESVYKKLKHDPTRGYKESTGGPPQRLERPGQDLPGPVQRPILNIRPGPMAILFSEDPQER